jgi:hypothetical protein
MKQTFSTKWKVTAILTSLLFVAGPQAPILHAGPWQSDGQHIRHVLLLSIDGMHVLDLINCAGGVSGLAPDCPNLAALANTHQLSGHRNL